MKKIIMTILVAGFLFGMTGCGEKKPISKEPEDSGIKSNTNENIIKDQKVDQLSFTNTSLIFEDGISKLTVSVTNDTDSDVPVDSFDIVLKDVDGNLITSLKGTVGGVVPAHETRIIVTSCTIDLSHANSIEYSIVNP